MTKPTPEPSVSERVERDALQGEIPRYRIDPEGALEACEYGMVVTYPDHLFDVRRLREERDNAFNALRKIADELADENSPSWYEANRALSKPAGLQEEKP